MERFKNNLDKVISRDELYDLVRNVDLEELAKIAVSNDAYKEVVDAIFAVGDMGMLSGFVEVYNNYKEREKN